MSEYSELVKQFQNIRTYVRDFYVYGFKSRNDYQEKSGRTYDNERRRIESWFAAYMKSCYVQGKKNVYIAVDSNQIDLNPLYQAWKAKSFTSNDIMLHFFILDLLQDGEERKLYEIADEIQCSYSVLFDIQTLRKKLSEYVEEGLLQVRKEGRSFLYQKNLTLNQEIPDEIIPLLDAVKYFQGCQAFGFLGAAILDNQNAKNDLFRMKHAFLVHTLEDEILYLLLTAMKEQTHVSIIHKSAKTNQAQNLYGIPLKFLISTQTGRRYLCLYMISNRRFTCLRLDQIMQVNKGESVLNYQEYRNSLERNLPFCFGVSFGQEHKMEKISMKIYVDEKREMYIVNRLEREGRGGVVTRLCENEYLYEGSFFDTNEASPWIKTFIGRILSLECSNPIIKQRFYRDIHKMAQMYMEES